MSVDRKASNSEFAQGLGILLVAQLLSAYMGAYTEDTYAIYQASWTENLFYSHVLSLPFFVPLSGTLRDQYRNLAATPHVDVRQYLLDDLEGKSTSAATTRMLEILCSSVETMPKGVLFLFINAVTQLACISGVSLLSAKSSAVTVTIVLNIRKLVSFIMSTLIFGHDLSAKMVLGSALVFGSGALYGWETSWRIPKHRKAKRTTNGTLSSGEKQQRRIEKTRGKE